MVIGQFKFNISKILFVFLLLGNSCLIAQVEYHFLIEFTDKSETDYSIDAPEFFLSQRALDRRIKEGVLIDSLDLPIVPRFIDSLYNFKVETTSKWFNLAVVSTNDSLKIQMLSNYSFISKITYIGNKGGSNKKLEKEWDYGPSEIQIDQVNGKFLHEKGLNGSGVLIGVIDVGFQNVNTISAFDSLFLNNQILSTYDFVEDEEDVYDDASHGTSVLSVLSAFEESVLIGTAPGSELLLLVSEDGFQENLIEEFNHIEAVEYADSFGVDVINTSLGYNTFHSDEFSHTKGELTGDSAWITKGTNVAARKGILMVTSAGNEGNGSWRTTTFPADAELGLTVGAVNAKGELGGFSSVGFPTVQDFVKPNVVAQGAQTYLVLGNGGYTTSNGTSFSSPQIAGWAACLMQAFPEKKSTEIKKAIEYSGSQYSSPDSLLGYGIPNFEDAYHYLKYNGFRNLGGGGVMLFPNPVSDQLNIVSETLYSSYKLMNAKGQLIIHEAVNNRAFQLDLSQLRAGTYFIEMKNDSTSEQRKFVKY